MANETQSNYTMGYSRSTLSSHASRTVESDAAFLLPHLKSTDKVLDIGYGPGTITLGFASHVPDGKVVGVDISEEAMHKAKERLAQQSSGEYSNVTFLTGDVIKGLDWIADGEFDVVYASQLFPHLPTEQTQVKALAEMRRVLKPGGILATRTVAEMHWYPAPSQRDDGSDNSRRRHLDELWSARMTRVFGTDGFVGPRMPALYRAAGFEKVAPGAGTTVYSSPEAKRWWAGGFAGRLDEGDPFRDSWLAAGVTEGEIKETKDALERWAEMESSWYVAVQADVLGWK